MTRVGPDDLGTPFRFDYDPATLRYGPNCVGDLGAELDALDRDRALLVTGSTVGETSAVMDPVRAGLGERLGGHFGGTTPQKRLGTAYEALAEFRETGADVIVAVGGGSSLDVATVVAVLAATDRTPDAMGTELVETGTLPVPDDGLPPVVTVPTTLAGADLSQVAGVTADPETCPVDSAASGGVSDPALMPATACYDPELLATTPPGVLAASAMNGFDKGIETLYARNATPVTDATAVRGLGLLHEGLRRLGSDGADERTLEPVVRGLLLVQYGVSRPGETTLSVIHAFGHGLTRHHDVQQGAAHAVVAPHVLRYLFDRVDGRRDLLAEALGVDDAPDAADAVVDAVAAVATPWTCRRGSGTSTVRAPTSSPRWPRRSSRTRSRRTRRPASTRRPRRWRPCYGNRTEPRRSRDSRTTAFVALRRAVRSPPSPSTASRSPNQHLVGPLHRGLAVDGSGDPNVDDATVVVHGVPGDDFGGDGEFVVGAERFVPPQLSDARRADDREVGEEAVDAPAHREARGVPAARDDAVR